MKARENTVAIIEFKWTISKGRDTYGYNICSMYHNGIKVSSCKGGGYDMQGTALSDWMQEKFRAELQKLDAREFYGLSFWNTKRNKTQFRWSKDCTTWLDGACGFSSMQKILDKLGYSLQYVPKRGENSTYEIKSA